MLECFPVNFKIVLVMTVHPYEKMGMPTMNEYCTSSLIHMEFAPHILTSSRSQGYKNCLRQLYNRIYSLTGRDTFHVTGNKVLIGLEANNYQ